MVFIKEEIAWRSVRFCKLCVEYSLSILKEYTTKEVLRNRLILRSSRVPGEERRAYRRFNVEFPIEYKFAAFQDQTTQASSLDISANGLRFRVKDKPIIDEEVHLIIDLPIKKRIKLAAKVAWSKAVENDCYDVGVKLADTKSEDGKIFMDFYSQQLLGFIASSKDRGNIIA